ncbi:MAG: acetate/propionate family kinase [Eubacteriales bacterium]
MKLLVINCGSSSIKIQLINMPNYEEEVRGVVERVGKENAIINLTIDNHNHKVIMPILDHLKGLKVILEMLFQGDQRVCDAGEIKGVGHRVVHGGDKLSASMIINEDVINYLIEISDLAPLHNPAHIAGIKACQELLPHVPQVAAFDNGYHNTLPKHVYMYPIPNKYYKDYNIRKFGFHGIAFRSITMGVQRLLHVKVNEKKMILLMLGSGTTANAVSYGKSVEVSTGFTPLEGLMQSTRCGDVDAAVFTYLMKKENLTPLDIENIANKESGWYGMSSISNDLREIYEASQKGDALAEVTMDALYHRIKKYIGAYAAILGGVDIIAFGGGVGENAWYLREKICRDLKFLGICLDEKNNRSILGEGIITHSESKVQVVVVKVNEEKIIAEDTYSLVHGDSEPRKI